MHEGAMLPVLGQDVSCTDLYEAVSGFVGIWGELAQTLPDDYGCTLTCGEAEALAGLFRAFRKEEIAESIIENHAAHDEPEEAHYQGGDE